MRSSRQTQAGGHVVQERARVVGEREGEARQVRPPFAQAQYQGLRQVKKSFC